MAFCKNGSLDPHGGPLLRRNILANSATYTELDALITDTDGFTAVATAGDALLGHLLGIVTNDGVGLDTTGAAGAETGSFEGTYTTASDNETSGKVQGEADISQLSLYSAEADAALGTNSGSDEKGVYFDLIDEDTIDESSVADTAAQYYSWGEDPNESDRLIVNIFESEVFTSV